MKQTVGNVKSWIVVMAVLFSMSGCLQKEDSGLSFTDGGDTSGGDGGTAPPSPPPVQPPPLDTNRAPTISGRPPTQVVEGGTYTFTPTSSDADGDRLTFSISNQPAWADFDSATGRLSGTTDSSDLGAFDNINISVTDGQASASLPAFDVSVVEHRDAEVFYAAPLSTSCNPSSPGSGTIDDPWTNPYYALVRGGLRPGDTLQLRGGTYKNTYFGFMADRSDDDRLSACDDDQRSSNGDGTHTVLPLLLAGLPGQEIVIENFPGETVVIDGTNARMESADWRQCGTDTYMTSDFNVGSSRTPQVWVDPAGPSDPGTRLRWNSDGSGSCALAPGEFAYSSDRDLYVRLPNGGDPSTHDLHMTCQGGDCASHPVHAGDGGEYMTVRRNPQGGSFYVKYGYYGGYVTGGAHHLIFDGIDWIGGGGRDYGFCFRIHDGHNVSVKNGICRETMAQGIGYYGGLSDVGINITNNTIEGMEIYDTGRGWVDGGGIGSNLGMGIILKNCSDCVVRDSRIFNTYRGGIQINHSSAGCPTGPCQGNNTLIERNEVFDFCRLRVGDDPMAGKSDCAAIIFRDDGTNGEIKGAMIRNNIVHGTYATPLSNDASPAGIYTDGPIADVSILNNSLNQIPGACIDVSPNSESVTIIGNAMNNCSTGRSGCNGQECALYINSNPANSTLYNTYWAPNGSTQVVKRKSGSGFSRDNVANNWEQTAVQTDPRFMSNSDLRIAESSGLVDVQPCQEAPNEDFNQMPRPQGGACDVGAYEQ